MCVGQRRFHDQYFDTPDFHLTLRDMWLRKRKGCWELKCPTATGGETEETSGEQSKEAALCTRYKEITNPLEIQQRVREAIKDNCGAEEGTCTLLEKDEGQAGMEAGCVSQGQPVIDPDRPKTAEKGLLQEDDSWLSDLHLVCFAEFTTARCSFTLEEEGVQVDLDQADFGYHVGEIEVLVSEGEDVQSALERIERTARKLGEPGAIVLSHTFNTLNTMHCYSCPQTHRVDAL